MGLMNVACAIYIGGFMALLGLVCIYGYFKNFHGKEEKSELEAKTC